jgi:hypothetical protein
VRFSVCGALLAPHFGFRLAKNERKCGAGDDAKVGMVVGASKNKCARRC